jgi:tape measure domain-containing protein
MGTAGEAVASLDLDLSLFSAKLDAAKTALQAVVSSPYVAQITAAVSGGGAAAAGGVAAAAGAAKSGAAAALTPIQQVQEATKNASVAIAAMNTAGAKGSAQWQVALKQVQTAHSQLVTSVSKAGGFAGLDPATATTATRQIDQLSAGLRNMGAGAKTTESSLSTMFRTLTKASFVFLGIMALKAAFEALGTAIQTVVAEAVRFEQTQIGFSKLFGSLEKGLNKLKELAAFAARTPFELVDVEKQASRLKAYGFAAAEIIPILRDVGDASSALGTGKEGIDRITLALGQMRSAGRVNSRDMLQLTEAFVPAWQYVAKATGKTTGEVRKLTEKGLIPAEEAIRAIRAGMQRNFGGMMEAQMQTLGGQWSNFKDKVTLGARAIGVEMLPALKSFVSDAASKLPRVTAFLTAMVKGTNDAGKALRTIGLAGKLIWVTIAPLLNLLRQVGSIITSALAGSWGNVGRKMLEWKLAAVVTLALVTNVVYKAITGVNLLASAWGNVATAAGLAGTAQVTAAGAGAGAAAGGAGGAAAGGAGGGMLANPATWKVAGLLGGLTISDKWANDFWNMLDGKKIRSKDEAWRDYYKSEDSIMPKPLRALMGTLSGAGDITRDPDKQPAAFKMPSYTGRVDPQQKVTQARDAYLKAKEKSGGKETEAVIAAQQELNAALVESADRFSDYTFEVNEGANAVNDMEKALEKIQVDGLTEVESAYKNAIDTAVKAREAQDGVTKAIKESGRGSAQYRSAVLEAKAAVAQAAEAKRLYRQVALGAALADKYGGEVGAWAAGVIIQGANAAARAQAGLRAVINSNIRAFNNMAAAAASAASQASNASAQLNTLSYEKYAMKSLTNAKTAQRKFDAINTGVKFKATPVPTVGGPSGAGGGGGGGKSAADKAAEAAERMRDAIKGAVKSAQDLAERFRDAVRGTANFAGLFERPDRAQPHRGIMGAARSQLRRLERYQAALKTLSRTLPKNIFQEIVDSGTESMDDVIRLARNPGMAQQWGKVIAQRNKVATVINRDYLMRDEINAGRRELVGEAVKSAKDKDLRITVNMNGSMSFSGGNKDARDFAREVAKQIDRELRARGVVA